MNISKNILIPRSEEKPISLDVFYKNGSKLPLVIYAHGFIGFKDWGNFDLIANQFAEAGFCFVKFNFSHNGTTPEQPEIFTDLEAFANNNYTKELNDLQAVIDWARSKENPRMPMIDKERIYLIGHSRGGGIVLLKGAEEPLVKKIAAWGSVAECTYPWGNWPQERLEQWEKNGRDFFTNSRTLQQMPLNYQLYQNFQENKERLNILAAVQRLQIPLLICHGTEDEPVPVSQAYALHEAGKNSELFLLKSDHVFGRTHPWKETSLPEPMQQVVSKTIAFFKSESGRGN